ncbi:MAG: sulfatase-like hydrolase/transferase [Pseudomonadota bacterium]
MAIRTRLLLSLFVLTGLLPGCTSVGPAAPSRPPNIVLIIADDLGIGDTGIYGSQTIMTPNIDSLAENGVRFTEGYVSHPVCSPSRAGLLTGQYQQRLGWEFNPAGRDVNSGLDTSVGTFADALAARGYATGMIGKWHLGYAGNFHPLKRGFDEYFGVLAGGSIFIDPQTPGVESIGSVSRQRDSRIAVYRNTEEVAVTEYLTDAFTHEAVDFISRNADQPFLLYVAHTAPHTPLQATAKYLDRYRHIADPTTRIYAAMVSSVDDSVGQIVKALADNNLLEDTMIVFLSDNGCASYIGSACSNAPFAGFKRYHQEGGIRVPFIMHWPAQLTPGTFDKPVISLDLLPTFVAAVDAAAVDTAAADAAAVDTAAVGTAAGGTAAGQDGVNLLPYLTGATSAAPHDFLYWRSGPTVAIRDAEWKLIRYQRSALTPGDLGDDGRLAPPENGWMADASLGYLTLLYNLRTDPGETTNLADAYPDEVNRLLKQHGTWARTLRTTPTLPPIRSTLAEMDGETVQLIF